MGIDVLEAMNPEKILIEINNIIPPEKNYKNGLQQADLGQMAYNKQVDMQDATTACQILRAVEFLHTQICPKDECKIKFSFKENSQIGKLWDLMYQKVEYKIYVPSIAKKIKWIQKIDLMYFDPLKDANQIIGKNDWRNADEATAILMAAAGILRQFYLEENRKYLMAGFSPCIWPYENWRKINNPRFKIIADYILKIERDFGNEEFNFDTTLIVYWIGCLCQNPLGISLDDLVKAITLKPADVGIT